jgi:hypothetical protein
VNSIFCINHGVLIPKAIANSSSFFIRQINSLFGYCPHDLA